jgi:hypothetical protein
VTFKIGDVVLPLGSGELAVVIRAPLDLPVAVRWADGEDGFYPPERLMMVRPFPSDPKWSENGERSSNIDDAVAP